VSNGVIEIEVVSGDPRLVQNTRIRRGLEGPQLIVEWDAPAQITTAMEIRVVRKKFEFAANPFDSQGTVVFEGPADAGFVTDIDLDRYRHRPGSVRVLLLHGLQPQLLRRRRMVVWPRISGQRNRYPDRVLRA
jgi:hypothetical protein